MEENREEEGGVQYQYLVLVGGLLILCAGIIWIGIQLSENPIELKSNEPMCVAYSCTWSNKTANVTLTWDQIHPDKTKYCYGTMSHPDGRLTPELAEIKTREILCSMLPDGW